VTVRHVRALALILALTGSVQSSAHADAASPGGPITPAANAGLETGLGRQLPLAARFHTSDGRDIALGDVLGNGKPVVLVLAYNRCTMLCSLVLRGVARLVKGFELRAGDQFSLVTISIDPSETVFEASRLQTALLDSAGIPGQTHDWEFLVGERVDIDAVANALGFRYAWDPGTQQYAHPAVVFAISPGGKVAGFFDGLDPDPNALRSALTNNPSTVAAATIEDVVLNCFRFDTAQSRYGSTITWLLRAGAAAVCLAIACLIWRLSRSQHPAARGQP
jgi:protein SCO1/2